MKCKYLQNSLIYRMTRDDDFLRMQKRIQSIKTSRGPFDTQKLALSLPRMAQKIPAQQPRLKIQKQNEQLVERIVQATEGSRSYLRRVLDDNLSSDRRIPRDYYYKMEEQRRIQLENQRLDKIISARRHKKMI